MRISPMIIGMAMGLLLKDTKIKAKLRCSALVGNVVTIFAGAVALLVL